MNQVKTLKQKIFLVIFILFVSRVLFLILFPPYIGIADNGDFQRLSVSVGLNYAYNPWSAENYNNTFFNYITNNFIHVAPLDNGWHQIFAIFPYMAIFLSDQLLNGNFDLRLLGFINACIYFIGVYLILNFIKRVNNFWSYIFLVLLIMVFSDSYILQYFNSFYTEPGSVSSILILWGLLLLGFSVIVNKNMVIRLLFLAAVTVDATFSVSNKQQDILLLFPVIWIIWHLLNDFKCNTFFKITWTICFLCINGVLFINNTAGGNITTYNVISMDILKYSDDPEEHLYAMGFNDSEVQIFLQGVGRNAFENDIPWKEYESYFSRSNELKILLREPNIILQMITNRSSALFQDDPKLGNYLKESGASPKEKTKENKLWSQLKSLFYGTGIVFYLLVITIAIIISLFGYKINAFMAIPNRKALFKIYTFLPLSNMLRFFTVILGDSSHDDIKHFFTLNVEFDVLYLINVCALVHIILYYTRFNPKINTGNPV